MKRTTILPCILLLVIVIASLAARAQEKESKPTAETKAEVQALTEFHAVIYKLWHTAWPKKDYELLASLLPEIQKRTDAIAQTELPGILREKKGAWGEGVKKLQGIVAEYQTAVEEKNNQQLMDAAERLHMQYEKLVRTIRPVLKELDNFHQVLYMVYHYYLPENRMDKLKAAVPEFQAAMAALNSAVLPERLKKKEESFMACRTKLATSVDELAVTVRGDNAEKIKAAVQKLHSNYEVLEKVFD